jgi:hypothetical protein
MQVQCAFQQSLYKTFCQYNDTIIINNSMHYDLQFQMQRTLKVIQCRIINQKLSSNLSIF